MIAVSTAMFAVSTAMFESKVHNWASLAIPQTTLKKPKHAQMGPGVTKAKTAAAMFSEPVCAHITQEYDHSYAVNQQ